MNAQRAVLPSVLALLAAGACQGNPPIHTGSGLLEIGVIANTGDRSVLSPQLALYNATPFFHWDYRADALTNDAPPSSQPVPEPFMLPSWALDFSPPLFTRYRSDSAFWFNIAGTATATLPATAFDVANQHEVLLFARDPHEFTDTLRSLRLFPDTCGGGCDSQIEDVDIAILPVEWDTQWVRTPFNGFRIPAPVAANVWYPPEAPWQTITPINSPTPTPVTIQSITTSNFWPTTPVNLGPPGGPGSGPDGSGSIKAVKVINHGVCSNFQPYTTNNSIAPGLLDIASQQLPTIVGMSDCPSIASVEMRWFRGGSFLDFTSNEDSDQIGGVFLNFNIQVNGNGLPTFGTGGPNIVWRSEHQFVLFDGRPTATGEALVTREIDYQGSGAANAYIGLVSTFTKQMSQPLPTSTSFGTVAEAIWKTADEKLVFPPSVLQPTCHQRNANDDTILWTSNPNPTDTNQCGAFIASTLASVNTALAHANTNPLLTLLGVSLSANEVNQIANTTLMARTPAGTFANFRCANFPDMNGIQQCQYVLPAKRLNVEPNGFELVFLDEAKELANPVYPIWLMALDQANNGQPSIVPSTPTALLRGLCDSPTAQTPGILGARPFIDVAASNVKVNCGSSNSVCSCVPGP